MSTLAHLWAIGYDDASRADEVRQVITRLRAREHALRLLDIAVVVRDADGSFCLDGEPFPMASSAKAHGMAKFLAELALSVPLLSGAAVEACLECAGAVEAADTVITDEFIRDVAATLKPGSSALFVLDDDGKLEQILPVIRGLGGIVVKANVDLERAKLIQSTLSAAPGKPVIPGKLPT